MVPRFYFPLTVGFLVLFNSVVWADEPTLPGTGWPASRYEALWTKSPFAVATPETGPDSPDYSLWGIAQIDGISYASVTNKQNSEHYLLATDKPDHGLTLVSIKRGADTSGTVAVVQKDGQLITLKLEQAPPPMAGANASSGMPLPNSPPQPGNPNPANLMAGGGNNFGRPPGAGPPPVSRRFPMVHAPPPIHPMPPQPPPPTQ